VIKLKKHTFTWDLLWLAVVTAIMFLVAHGVTTAKRAYGAPMAAPASSLEAVKQRAERRDDGDGGPMCMPCKGPHIDLRSGEYRFIAGPGPGLRLLQPWEIRN